MIITVTPAPSLDRTYTLADYAEGHVNRALESTIEASGKGVNVSRDLATAGVGTVAVLPAGGAEGRQLLELLSAENVVYRVIDVPGATRVNTTISVAHRPTTKVNAPAAALGSDVIAALLGAVGELAGPGDWLLCAGTLPAGAIHLPAELVRMATAIGARSAVDTSGAALTEALAAGPDLLAPNHLELAELVGADASALTPDGATIGALGDEQLVTLAAGWSRQLRERTGAVVLATLGASGAVYTGPAGTFHAIAPPIVPVNTAGAGDALLAGFLSIAGGAGWTDAEVADPGGALATAVSWGTAAAGMASTAGHVAARADPAAVTLRPIS